MCLSNEEKRVVRDYVGGITTGIRREDGESLASREANPTKVRVRGTGTRRGTHMRGDALEVRLYGLRAGTLRRTGTKTFCFQYDPAYAEDDAAPPLGARLARRREAYGNEETKRWFEGLLPEGERRREQQVPVKAQSIETWTLLAAAGGECAGAVQIGGEGDYTEEPWLDRLDGDAVQALLGHEIDDDHQKRYRAARISLAGAQPKIALYRHEDGTWSVPRGGHPSTHILKPDTGWFPEMAANEHWCMTVARYAGVQAARTEIATFGHIATLVITRYDRSSEKDAMPARLHQEDLAQALGFDTTNKYEAFGGPTGSDMFDAPGVDPGRLFEQMVFNWIIGNCDAHAKNYSILEPGTPHARLSPAYDVMSSECYELPQKLATSIGEVRALSAVNAEAIEALGEDAGLSRAQTRVRTHGVAGRCAEAVERCQEEGIASGPVDTARIEQRIEDVLTWWNGEPGYRSALTPAERALRKMMKRYRGRAKPVSAREHHLEHRRGQDPGP